MKNIILSTSNNMLTPGTVSEEQFIILIDISPVRSNKVINALHDYFVFGKKRCDVCETFQVNPGYLSIKIRELQALCKRILEIHPYFAQSEIPLK
ncbi:hypothetical protein D1797_15410 [Salmonella enterica subsp. enterica serovar Freetown]|nr:hypothetical protein [Salmonella enterica subsp. enterica serovar Freetown]EBH8792423.1 hypothetical protein [Salmonella enterica subsp. enterica serovar Freetown]EBN9932556.1 hypothetical protein [Salmonella enterica]EBP0843343.1 hypothetical protein [Salmonella enterica]